MSDFQEDKKKLLEDEFKVYKEKMNKEAELKGETILWGHTEEERKGTRRIFKIDVGNLPKEKAEDYIKKLKEKYRHLNEN
jgi:hypothetical protein